MKTVLLFTVPPLVGALIGFLTNVVAIRMLFRPLKEIRVFGIRLPFTPGILPRQRRKLADSIGAMVERELLTPELLRQRLAREDVRNQIKISVSRFTAEILEKPLEAFGGSAGSGPASGLSGFVLSLGTSFLNSPAFEDLLKALGKSISENLNFSLVDVLGGDELEQSLAAFTGNEIRNHAGAIVRGIRTEAGRLYPKAAERFIDFLRQTTVHQELEIHGLVFLNKAIMKMNVFQRLFISAAQYEKTLNERMPEIIDDLIDQMESVFKDEAKQQRFLDFSTRTLERYLESEKAPLNRLIARFICGELHTPLNELPAKLGLSCSWDRILTFLRARLGEGVSSFKNKLLEQWGAKSAGELLSLEGEKKETLDEYLTAAVLRIADTQMERALESIDVRSLVSERIDSLEMIRVERIILDVMADQLKWIDVFGAILGFLIGAFQAVFSWFIT
jgi:uncharacterized membrane protein YheB (UPF0754 family)